MDHCFIHICGTAWEVHVPIVDIAQGELLVKKILALKQVGSINPIEIHDGDMRVVGFIIPAAVEMAMFKVRSDKLEQLQMQVLQQQLVHLKKITD